MVLLKLNVELHVHYFFRFFFGGGEVNIMSVSLFFFGGGKDKY